MKKYLIPCLTVLFVNLQAQDPQQTVDALYESITYDGESMPDFKEGLKLFTEDAHFSWVNDSAVMQFTPAEFLEVYENQIKQGIILEASEFEISNEAEVYGGIAHYFSSYKAEVRTPDGTHLKRGINSIQLIKNEADDWKITAMVWYDENPENPLPLMLDDRYSSDRGKIKQAAGNYIASIYKTDTSLLASVSRDLVKQGYYYSQKDKSWSVLPMTYEELKHTAATYNTKDWIPAAAPAKVEILDMDERVANVKVYAIWGFDYLLMIKSDAGEWIVKQILWQSYNKQDHSEMVRKIKEAGE